MKSTFQEESGQETIFQEKTWSAKATIQGDSSQLNYISKEGGQKNYYSRGK